VVKTTVASKKKKKKWWPLIAPKSLGDKPLGQTTAYEAAELKGRHVNVTVAQLIGDMKKQGIYISLRVVDIEDNKAICSVVKYQLSNGMLKRLVKRGREKVTDSFVVKTKDEQFIRIKPLLIGQRTTNRAIATKLRKGARMILKDYCHSTDYDNIINDLIRSVLQKKIKEKLTKLYPLRAVDIHMLKIETRTLRETVDEKGTDIILEKPKEEELEEPEAAHAEVQA